MLRNLIVRIPMMNFMFINLRYCADAYDDFSRNKGINPNFLIHSGRDPLSGNPVWWDTPVKITRV